MGESKNKKEKAKLLPDPVGYRILVTPVEIEEKTDGGIFIPDDLRDRESVATVIAMVIKLGPSAYKDTAKFPEGPWCKEGDFILIRPYQGTRVKVKGTEFRIINDDTVEAVIQDPRGVERA